ncbi:MAG: hypothetical protein Q8P80_02505 [Candidatus Levybacteria bacterium]|nr:hypothetical protein [Candidatus Levybacteria bacterium]
MNFKKIAITAAAGALLLSAAMPAFAHGRRSSDLEIKIENKDTRVTNRVLTVANTGLNSVNGEENGESGSLGHGGSRGRGGSITTGDAWASSDVLNQVNTNTVDLCGCLSDRRGDVEVKIENEDTNVTNRVLTVANTGLNEVNGQGRIRTGNAGAEGVITNVVNTNVVN